MYDARACKQGFAVYIFNKESKRRLSLAMDSQYDLHLSAKNVEILGSSTLHSPDRLT